MNIEKKKQLRKQAVIKSLNTLNVECASMSSNEYVRTLKMMSKRLRAIREIENTKK